jgi:hypothetical protein
MLIEARRLGAAAVFLLSPARQGDQPDGFAPGLRPTAINLRQCRDNFLSESDCYEINK